MAGTDGENGENRNAGNNGADHGQSSQRQRGNGQTVLARALTRLLLRQSHESPFLT